MVGTPLFYVGMINGIGQGSDWGYLLFRQFGLDIAYG